MFPISPAHPRQFPPYPGQTPPPSYTFRCDYLSCYYWVMGTCPYADHECYYTHHYTGYIGPNKADKTKTCIWWARYGHCWRGEDKCRYAHFHTGRPSRAQGGFNYLYRTDCVVEEPETSQPDQPSTSRDPCVKEPDTSTAGERVDLETSPAEPKRRGRWIKSNWRPVELPEPQGDSSSDLSTAFISSPGSSPTTDPSTASSSSPGSSSETNSSTISSSSQGSSPEMDLADYETIQSEHIAHLCRFGRPCAADFMGVEAT